MHVIGTAGHVDHGKSTLVQALSGIDPDRLREEKDRGMTIDLGFAWLTLPSGESVGIVDVPGHADFIKNMLAGVGSIDAAMLVVAADEGVMPQTREHLDILDLLNVERGLVALTKVDMAEDDDWLDLVEADLAETLTGTALENAPILRVSAVSGDGLPELRTALDKLLKETPDRADKGRPRLFVDRVFTVSGFGTVVTGTLIDGAFSVGQEVEILPSGQKSRIRGLQSHKKSVEQAVPGSRVAINLTNISKSEINRGDVVTLPGWLEPSRLIDTRLRCLAGAVRPLKHNQQVDVFTGAIEASAHLRLLGAKEVQPGEEAWVQLRLERHIPVVKGDHFIIRRPSPSQTIGGGVVVDPLPRRRHRRFRADLLHRLETLAHGTPEDLLRDTLDRLGPIQVKALLSQNTLPESNLETVLNALLQSGDVFQIPQVAVPTVITKLRTSKTIVASKAGWRNQVELLRHHLTGYHRRNSLRQGMPKGELMSKSRLETGVFNKIIEQAATDGMLKATETAIWLADHTPQYSTEQRQVMDNLLAKFAKNPYATPSYKESLAALARNEDLLNAMIDNGTLLRLSQDVLLLPETFEKFVAWLKDFAAEHRGVTVAQVRDAINTSRKYALAMLEYTDSRGITRRVGDERILR